MKKDFLKYDDAVSLMIKLCGKSKNPDVGVFVDRGWGDSGNIETYQIIKDGDGQKPLGEITKETFNLLYKKKIVGGNILITFKARRFHPFLKDKVDRSKLGKNLYRNTAQGS